MTQQKKGFTLIIGFGFLTLSIYFFYLEWKDLTGDLGIKKCFLTVGMESLVSFP